MLKNYMFVILYKYLKPLFFTYSSVLNHARNLKFKIHVTNLDDDTFSFSVAFMRFIFRFTFTCCILFELTIIVFPSLKVNGPAKVNVSPLLL